MKFEGKKEPFLPRSSFIFRLLRHLAIAALIVFFSLGIGILGYGYFEGMSFIDALLNAAMILGGMGPVAQLHTVNGKLFASFYALFAAFIILTVAGVIFAPLVHRLLHRFHLDDPEDG